MKDLCPAPKRGLCLYSNISQALLGDARPYPPRSFAAPTRLAIVNASTGRAFRLPSYTDLYYRDPGNVGNPNLKPQSAWSYEGGLEWNRTGRFKAAITAFQMREQNVIDYVLFPDNLYHAANIERLNFTGVETSAELRLSDVSG